MAATDYVIVTGWMNAYLTKKKKPTKNGPQVMSEDPVYNKLVNSIVGKAIAKHFFELGLAQK